MKYDKIKKKLIKNSSQPGLTRLTHYSRHDLDQENKNILTKEELDKQDKVK